MATKTQTAVRQVLDTIPLVMRTLASEFRRTGYTLVPVHFLLLAILAEHPRNLSELAEKHRVSRPTMSNSITRLVERGWVRRVRDRDDRRMVLVELTPAGQTALSEIRDHIEVRVTELLASLSPTECDQLLAGLAILSAVFGRAAENTQCAE